MNTDCLKRKSKTFLILLEGPDSSAFPIPMFDAKVDPCILFSILVYTAVWSVWSSLFGLYPQIIGEVFPKSVTLLSVCTLVYKAVWSVSSSFFVLYPQIIRVSFSAILWVWLWAITHITNNSKCVQISSTCAAQRFHLHVNPTQIAISKLTCWDSICVILDKN